MRDGKVHIVAPNDGIIGNHRYTGARFFETTLGFLFRLAIFENTARIAFILKM